MLTRVEDYGDTMLVVGDNICATIDKTDGSIAVEEATENLTTPQEWSIKTLVHNFYRTFSTITANGTFVIYFEFNGEFIPENLTVQAIKGGIGSDMSNKFKKLSGHIYFSILTTTLDVFNGLQLKGELGKYGKMRLLKIEKRSYPTSYVLDARPMGKLIINKKFGTSKVLSFAFFWENKSKHLNIRAYSTILEIESSIDQDIIYIRSYNGESQDIMFYRGPNFDFIYADLINNSWNNIVVLNVSTGLFIYLNGKLVLKDNHMNNSVNIKIGNYRNGLESFNGRFKNIYIGNSNEVWENPDGTPNEAYIQKVANSKGFLPKGGIPSWLPEL